MIRPANPSAQIVTPMYRPGENPAAGTSDPGKRVTATPDPDVTSSAPAHVRAYLISGDAVFQKKWLLNAWNLTARVLHTG